MMIIWDARTECSGSYWALFYMYIRWVHHYVCASSLIYILGTIYYSLAACTGLGHILTFHKMYIFVFIFIFVNFLTKDFWHFIYALVYVRTYVTNNYGDESLREDYRRKLKVFTIYYR